MVIGERASVHRFTKLKPLLAASALAAAALLSACGPSEPPKPAPPPPPPPPPVVVIPPRPVPPASAYSGFVLPPMGPDGLFVSVNRGISPNQMTWNLRSAYNVGALNCPEPARTEITNSYGAFLRTNARKLTAVNKGVDAEFRARYGAKFIAPREKYITELYNHFAFPPTLPEFCNAVLTMSREGATIKPADLDTFAARHLPSIEIVFDSFYLRFAKYRSALAEWEARYGALVNAQPSTGSLQTRAQ